MGIRRLKTYIYIACIIFLLNSDALADIKLEMISVDPSVPSIVVILTDVLIDYGDIILFLIVMILLSIEDFYSVLLWNVELLENPFCFSGHEPDFFALKNFSFTLFMMPRFSHF